jgi:16S rRNA G966 N2-methylase RsmD
VVYLDPPYEAEAEYAGTLGLLGTSSGGRMIAPGGVVVAEYASKSRFALAERYGGLVRTRTYKQGETMLGFYEVADGVNGLPV